MIWQVVRKAVPAAISAILVSSFSSAFPILASPVSSEVSLQGRPTAWTPFDRKVESSGIFPLSPPEDKSILAPNALEELFQRARRFRYSHDTMGDTWQTPEETERRFSGDCEDKSVWLFARLKEAGYANVRIVIGKYRMHDSNYHVWVTYASETGETYILDAAMQNRVWQTQQGSSGLYNPFFSFDGETRYRHRGFTN